MHSTKLEAKLDRIVALYTNGASASAKEAVRKLKKVELATLLVEGHRLPSHPPADRAWEWDFHKWVLHTLEGYE